MEPPEGFELLPEDLANPSVLNVEVGAEEVVGDQPGEEVAGDMAIELHGDKGEGQEEGGDQSGLYKVFLCVKVSPTSEKTEANQHYQADNCCRLNAI